MKYEYFLVLSCLCISCVTRPTTGVYAWRAFDNSVIIHLDSNNRFSYNARYGPSHRVTAGDWIISGNEIIFTSDSNYTSTYGSVKEEIDPKKGDYLLQLLDFKCSEPEKGLEVIINGIYNLKTDSIGQIKLQAPIRTVQIKSDLIDYFYYVKNYNSNSITACISVGMSYEVFFYKEAFKIRKRTIIMPDGLVLKKEK